MRGRGAPSIKEVDTAPVFVTAVPLDDDDDAPTSSPLLPVKAIRIYWRSPLLSPTTIEERAGVKSIKIKTSRMALHIDIHQAKVHLFLHILS